jgi:hypothetical protein
MAERNSGTPCVAASRKNLRTPNVDATERPSSALAFLDDLQHALDG